MAATLQSQMGWKLPYRIETTAIHCANYTYRYIVLRMERDNYAFYMTITHGCVHDYSIYKILDLHISCMCHHSYVFEMLPFSYTLLK